MLLQNVTIIAQYPVTFSGGAFNGEAPLLGLGDESFINYYTREVDNNETCGIPNGYNANTSWFPPLRNGGMAIYKGIDGVATFTSDNPGSSTTINGVATFTPNISSVLQAVATIAGTSSISTANLGAIVSLVSSIIASGNLTNVDLKALAEVTATIQIGGTGYLSQMDIENLANAVWDVLIANHLSAGSAGEFLNGAGGGSSPSAIANAVLEELLSGHVTTGTLGKAISDIKNNSGLIPALL